MREFIHNTTTGKGRLSPCNTPIMHILRPVLALFPQEKEGVLFVYGTTTIRANGRHWVKAYYDPEVQMSCLEIGDEVISTKIFFPTHKLSQLLADAFEAQASDTNAIGTKSWLEDRVGGHYPQNAVKSR